MNQVYLRRFKCLSSFKSPNPL